MYFPHTEKSWLRARVTIVTAATPTQNMGALTPKRTVSSSCVTALGSVAPGQWRRRFCCSRPSQGRSCRPAGARFGRWGMHPPCRAGDPGRVVVVAHGCCSPRRAGRGGLTPPPCGQPCLSRRSSSLQWLRYRRGLVCPSPRPPPLRGRAGVLGACTPSAGAVSWGAAAGAIAGVSGRAEPSPSPASPLLSLAPRSFCFLCAHPGLSAPQPAPPAFWQWLRLRWVGSGRGQQKHAAGFISGRAVIPRLVLRDLSERGRPVSPNGVPAAGLPSPSLPLQPQPKVLQSSRHLSDVECTQKGVLPCPWRRSRPLILCQIPVPSDGPGLRPAVQCARRMPPSGSRSLLGLGCQNCSRLRTPQWEITKGPGGCVAPAGAAGEGTVPGTCRALPKEAEAARPQGSSTRWQL